MTEVRMKNLYIMHIHPNRMGAIRDIEVKQLFLTVKPQRLEFRGSKKPLSVINLYLIYFNHCTAVL